MAGRQSTPGLVRGRRERSEGSEGAREKRSEGHRTSSGRRHSTTERRPTLYYKRASRLPNKSVVGMRDPLGCVLNLNCPNLNCP
eukprot:6610012-Pyramimonas_sp.AAC.1